MSIPLAIGLAGVFGTGILISRYLNWRHDATLQRLDCAPHQVPGRFQVSRDDVSDELPLPRRALPALPVDGTPLSPGEKVAEIAALALAYRSDPAPEPTYRRTP